MRYTEAGFDLEIDLTRGSIEKVATDPRSVELYLGGQGTAEQVLWDRVPPEIDPLSPDNLLIFSAGLLAGTPVPGANRTSISCIDPQSGFYVNSGLGGSFAPELRHAGYDKIIIGGKSEDLVYLWIHDDKVDICDAGFLEGKSALEAAALIRQKLKDDKIQVAAIGLAGENAVYQATIDHENTSASRGVGVVMGDKRLKAIAVRGTKDIHVAQPAELFELCKKAQKDIFENGKCGDVLLRENDDSWRIGNANAAKTHDRIKGFWTKELQAEWEVRVENEILSHQWQSFHQELEEVRDTVVDKSKILRATGCFNCSKDCHEVVYLPGGRKYFLKNFSKLAYVMTAYEDMRLNYELLAALQDYGLDEFAVPQIIVFAISLYENKILTAEDLPDFPQDGVGRFSYLLEKIARRDGIGDALANGVFRAARQIGKGAEAYDYTAKKIEHVPVTREADDYAYFLMYAAAGRTSITQTEGSFPQAAIPDMNEREAFVRNWDAAPERFKNYLMEWAPDQQLSTDAAINVADWNDIMHFVDDALGICPLLSSFRGQFGGRPPFHIYNLPKFIELAVGLDIDMEGLWKVAARNRNLVRAINVRRGLRKTDDTPPRDLWPNGEPESAPGLLSAYYEFQGWTNDGIPAKETLDRMELHYVSEDLVTRGIFEVTK